MPSPPQLLSSSQRAALLAFPDPTSDLLARFYTLGPQELALIRERRKPRNRLGVALLALHVQHLGAFPATDQDLPSAVIETVAQQLDVDPGDYARYARRDETRREHQLQVAAALGYTAMTSVHYRQVVTWLRPLAAGTARGLPLVTALLDHLREQKWLLPPITVLERLATLALRRAQREATRQLTLGLSPVQCSALDRLLEVPDRERLTPLAWLRQSRAKASPASILALLSRLDAIRALDLPLDAGAHIHPNRLRLMAREGAQITPQHFRDLEAERRYALLMASLLDRAESLTDEILDLHDRILLNMNRQSRHRQETQVLASQDTLAASLRVFAQAGQALLRAREAHRDPFEAIEQVLTWDTFTQTVEELLTLAKPGSSDPLAFLGLHYAAVRRYAPRLLDRLVFTGIASTRTLLRAVTILRDLNATGKRTVPSGAPVDFIPARWMPFVLTGDQIDRRYYELCVLSELRHRLRAGDLWVAGSRKYRDFDAHLLPAQEWRTQAGPTALPISLDYADYWGDKMQRLNQELNVVTRLLARGELPDVSFKGGKLSVSPLAATVPKEAEQLASRLYRLVPRVKITQLLLDVDAWTGFSRQFTHLHSGEAPGSTTGVLTVVLADAINLGLSKMAEASPGLTERQLAWTAQWHVRDDTYSAALAEIVNAQGRQPLAAVWGEGTTSSSDGQRFRTGAQGRASGQVNLRYGPEPGVTFYTHVSDQYAPFHTKVIAANIRDATHVLDGLLYHEADLQIEEHYTDTHGYTEHVFALCDLLGFRFAPRIRDLGDSRLFIAKRDDPGVVLEPLIGGRLNERLIATHWDDILRLAASIRSGTTTASLMLSKLGSYSRRNGLANALRELGRAQRTLFTLEWLQSPALRKRVQIGLNKGEARNALSRAVYFHRNGEVRDRRPTAQANRASGLNFVVAAIALWNTVHLQRAVQQLRQQGEDVPDDLIQHVSPLAWEHIGLTGDYLWEQPSRI